MLIDDTRPSLLTQTASILFYMGSSVGTVFINKNILKDSKEKAGGLFITWYQLVVEQIFILLSTSIFQRIPFLNIFPPLKFQKEYLKIMILPGILMSLSISMSNKCLEYSSVTSYQISRSLTIIFNIVFSYCLLNIRTSLKAIIACIGVIVGFVIGLDGDKSGSIISLIMGISSSIALALYSTTLRRATDTLNNQFEVIEYIIPIAIFSLSFVVALFGEFAPLFEKHSTKFWINQTIGGITGIFINVASIICIKNTSPLAHNLAGTVASTVTAIIGYLVFNDDFTTKKLIGTLMVIGFSGLYGLIKRLEKKNNDDSDILISADPNYKFDPTQFGEQSNEEEEDSKINVVDIPIDSDSEPSAALLENI